MFEIPKEFKAKINIEEITIYKAIKRSKNGNLFISSKKLTLVSFSLLIIIFLRVKKMAIIILVMI